MYFLVLNLLFMGKKVYIFSFFKKGNSVLRRKKNLLQLTNAFWCFVSLKFFILSLFMYFLVLKLTFYEEIKIIFFVLQERQFSLTKKNIELYVWLLFFKTYKSENMKSNMFETKNIFNMCIRIYYLVINNTRNIKCFIYLC